MAYGREGKTKSFRCEVDPMGVPIMPGSQSAEPAGGLLVKGCCWEDYVSVLLRLCDDYCSLCCAVLFVLQVFLSC